MFSDGISSSTVFLCTYPDSLGGNLKALKEVMDTIFDRAFSGVHILPFYPSGGDRGFAPLTHLKVDERWGDWSDIETLAKDLIVMSDLIAGHIATASPEYKDFLVHKDKSPFAKLFLSSKGVWPDGVATLEGLALLSHYTNRIPLQLISFGDGSQELLFRSYLPEQADLDISTGETRSLLVSYIEKLYCHGVKILRFDAVETLVKHPFHGFFCDKSKLEVTKWLHEEVSKRNMQGLAEVFVNHEVAKRYHDQGLFTYAFGLVDYITNAFYSQSIQNIITYLNFISKTKFTFISNHDGFVVGLNDVGIDLKEMVATRSWLLKNAGESSQRGSGDCFKNINIYAINGTLMEVLGRKEDAWFIAQALVVFSPGIPILYYNDILQGLNDVDLMHLTGEGRSLHRHNYSLSEIREAVALPKVRELLKCIKLRSTHSAFKGSSQWEKVSASSFRGVWQGDKGSIEVLFDFCTFEFHLEVMGE